MCVWPLCLSDPTATLYPLRSVCTRVVIDSGGGYRWIVIALEQSQSVGVETLDYPRVVFPVRLTGVWPLLRFYPSSLCIQWVFPKNNNKTVNSTNFKSTECVLGL